MFDILLIKKIFQQVKIQTWQYLFLFPVNVKNLKYSFDVSCLKLCKMQIFKYVFFLNNPSCSTREFKPTNTNGVIFIWSYIIIYQLALCIHILTLQSFCIWDLSRSSFVAKLHYEENLRAWTSCPEICLMSLKTICERLGLGLGIFSETQI